LSSEVDFLITAIGVGVLMIILFFAIGQVGGEKRITSKAAIAFFMIIAGLIFIKITWLGYSLIGVGGALAIFDTLIKSRKK